MLIINVHVEFLLMQDKFDPFKVFRVEYEFDIIDLDKLYYDLFKKGENISQLNLSYNFLKNPIKKIIFLCEFYNISTKVDFIEIIKIKNSSLEEQEKMKNLYLNKAIQEAKLKNWQMASFYINYVIYI